MSATIAVKIQNPVTGDLYELPFSAISFTEELNGGKDAQFSFDFIALQDIAKAYNTNPLFLLTSSYREIWVEMNGSKIWYGAISDFHLTKDAQGLFQLNVYGLGFFSLFQKRRTNNSTVFTTVDAGQIAWSLINTSQQADLPYSDLGITQGSVPASTTRTIEYNFAEIRQTIIDLSNAKVKNGFDFDIDNTKKFNVYYPFKGTTRNNIILDDKNLLGWAAVKNLLTNITNKVYVVGKGINTDVAYVYVSASSDYKSAFKVLEDTISDKALDSLTNLTDEANMFLAYNQAPILTLTLKHHGEDLDVTSFVLGDIIFVTIPELSLSLASFRVKKRQVHIDENGNILVDVDLQTI